MFERPPAQREAWSWLAVALWSGVIFATIPVARAIERAVEGAWGKSFFLHAVIAALVAAIAATIRRLQARGGIAPGRAFWLAAVGAVYLGYAWSLRGNPIEAVHFIEYGVLGLLAFRALSHRMRDTGIYLAAALAGGIVGILDEAIQWATPERVWDLRDVWFNLFGASFVQIGIAGAIRPPYVSGRPSAATVRRLCRIAALAVLLLAASLLNSPRRIDWVGRHVPGLGFLRSGDVMLEYGHLYEDPEIGVFRSRLSPAELRRADRERGAEAGAILAATSDDDYPEFLGLYSPITDPFVHEARVHLFRRDRYLGTAQADPRGREHRSLVTVGVRENRILEKYFPNTLRHSSRALPPERVAELEATQLAEKPYDSRVSRSLITRYGERHVVVGAGALLLLLAAVHAAAGRRPGARP